MIEQAIMKVTLAVQAKPRERRKATALGTSDARPLSCMSEWPVEPTFM